MEFSLTDEQVMFRNMAREFAQRHIEPVAKEHDQEEHFPWEIVKQLVPLGLLGSLVPQEYGGLGLDYISHAIVIEEVARVSLSLAMSVFGGHSVVEEMLITWGNEEQKQKYLRPMCTGELFGGYALSESGAGIDVRNMNSKAELSQTGWVLNGEKVFVINGGVSSLVLMIAKASKGGQEQGIGAFLVGRDIAGFSSQDIQGKNGLRACNMANVYFQDCQVAQENVLGTVDNDNKIVESLLKGVHFAIAAGCVGAAQACIDASIKYAEERQAFGRTISKFDMIQETIADMIVGTEAARLLTYHVADLKSKGQPFSKQLAMARYLASDVATRTATNAIQIHGAYGFGKDFPLERYFRDVAELTEYGGSPLIHKLMVARHSFGIPSTG